MDAGRHHPNADLRPGACCLDLLFLGCHGCVIPLLVALGEPFSVRLHLLGEGLFGTVETPAQRLPQELLLPYVVPQRTHLRPDNVVNTGTTRRQQPTPYEPAGIWSA